MAHPPLPLRCPSTASPQAARDKADLSDPGSVAAPMAGEVIEVRAAPGSFVKAGQVGWVTRAGGLGRRAEGGRASAA